KQTLVTLLLIVFCQLTFAQTTSQNKNIPPRNSIVSLYPFAFIAGNFRLGFEQRISDATTIKVIPSLGLADHSTFYNLDDYFGLSIEGMLKYFPLKKSPNGFYGSAYLIYKYAEGTGNNYYDVYTPYPSPSPTNRTGNARA